MYRRMPASRPSPAPQQWRVLTLLRKPKTRFIFLQALVSIILSYELLFSPEIIISFAAEQALAIGFWVLTFSLAFLKAPYFRARWFVGSIAVTDTVLAVTAIYLSGNANSHFFIAFFLLIFIAASVPKLKQILALSVLVSVGYSLAVYHVMAASGSVSFGHLMGIPVLLVMGLFYGITLESLAQERAEKITLLEQVQTLKFEETELWKTRAELQLQLEGLKREVASVNEDLRLARMRQEVLERRLGQSHRLEAVARLAAVMARDFNGLLRVIGLQAQQLLSRVGAQDPIRRHIERILAAGDRASVLTGNLIDFSRQEAEDLDNVPLNITVQQQRSMLRSLLPQDIELELVLDPSLHAVQADRGQLEMAIMNLVVNARDAMRGGGRLTIETRSARQDECLTLPVGDRDGRPFVVVSIRDTGCGMTEEVEARLFEPFFSTKEQGSGRGLSTVYGIVRRSGGFVEVKSRPGEGTSCNLYLPAADDMIGFREPEEPAAYGSGTSRTVLLVEEDEVFRNLALASLLRHDYLVLEAKTPVEALLLAQNYPGTIHLVVSNTLMHDITGRELVGQLSERHPRLRVVYLGGYPDHILFDEGLQGAGFLQKPCTQQDLVEKVDMVLSVD